jgi:adenosylcobinamide-GDP ribazoletransferase
MIALRAAMSFLTVLPVAPRGAVQTLTPARAYFPLVGLMLGGALAGLDAGLRQPFPLFLVGALLIVASLVLTRAIHFDGFLDSCDALFGGFDRARRLEILRDPRVGSFAVAGGVSLLLVKWATIVAIAGPVRLEVLVLFPCLSRWGVTLAMQAFPYVRESGLGSGFQQGRSLSQVAVGLATCVVAAVLLAGGAGAILVASVTLVSWATGKWMTRLLGGLTGDSYGAVNEVGEVSVLLLAIAIWEGAPGLFDSPLGG